MIYGVVIFKFSASSSSSKKSSSSQLSSISSILYFKIAFLFCLKWFIELFCDDLESKLIKGFKGLLKEKTNFHPMQYKSHLNQTCFVVFKSQMNLIIKLKYFLIFFNGIFANPKDNKESLQDKKFLYFLSTGLRLDILEELTEYKVLTSIFPFKKFISKIKSSVNKFILR